MSLAAHESKIRAALGRERENDRRLERARTILNWELERGMDPGFRGSEVEIP